MLVGQFLKIDQQQKTLVLTSEDERSILCSWCHHQFASVSITPASCGLRFVQSNHLSLDAITGAPGFSYLVFSRSAVSNQLFY